MDPAELKGVVKAISEAGVDAIAVSTLFSFAKTENDAESPLP